MEKREWWHLIWKSKPATAISVKYISANNINVREISSCEKKTIVIDWLRRPHSFILCSWLCFFFLWTNADQGISIDTLKTSEPKGSNYLLKQKDGSRELDWIIILVLKCLHGDLQFESPTMCIGWWIKQKSPELLTKTWNVMNMNFPLYYSDRKCKQASEKPNDPFNKM